MHDTTDFCLPILLINFIDHMSSRAAETVQTRLNATGTDLDVTLSLH